MTILVLGASGKTGRLVVSQLLAKDISVHVIVRSAPCFYQLFSSEHLKSKKITITEATVLNLSAQALTTIIKECTAVISCLGHNLSFSGMYGQPRKLVVDSVKRICESINNTETQNTPIKFILMNTTGNQNKTMGEQVSFLQNIVVCIIRRLIPPHADNESAAAYLQNHYSKSNKFISWSVVRPDTLIDNKEFSQYKIYPSPIRSAIFNSGKTSRINAAHFMVELAITPTLWAKWKSKMPVIYNSVSE